MGDVLAFNSEKKNLKGMGVGVGVSLRNRPMSLGGIIMNKVFFCPQGSIFPRTPCFGQNTLLRAPTKHMVLNICSIQL